MRTLRNIFIATSLIPFSFCGQKKETVQPVRQQIIESVYATGRIKADNQYLAFAALPGIIKKIEVSEGTLVKEGQILMRLQNDKALYQLESAKISEDYLRSNADNNAPAILEAKRQVDNTKAIYQQDSVNADRLAALLDQGVGKKVEVEQAQLKALTSKNQWIQAQQRLSFIQQQSKNESQKAIQQVNAQRSTLDDGIISAKVKGKVYALYKEEGELATQQEPLLLIGDASQFYFEAEIDEADIALVQLNMETIIGLDAFANQTFKGKVIEIYPALNTNTRTGQIRIGFTEVPPNLMPGMSAEANILIAKANNALVIPSAFLLQGNKVIDDKGDTIAVVTGIQNLEWVEIKSGLTEQSIITKP